MIIGFTGSRQGLTHAQARALFWVIQDLIWDQDYIEAHHGDCVGGDETFHNICRELSFDFIIVHPPKDDKLRAYCQGDNILASKDYSERNQDIVNASNYVIGAPLDNSQKGGTWQTIKMAQEKGNLYKVVFPDGTVVDG